MLGKVLSYFCCCFSILTSSSGLSSNNKHKRYSRSKHKNNLNNAYPMSPEQCSSPIDDPSMMSEPILPQCPFIDDSNVMSIDESSTSLPSESPLDHSLNNSARITAIRELIETEERYVHDLRTVDREFIKPLNNGKILDDHEVEQLFSNWYSLIACNCIFLSKLQEHIRTSELNMSDEILYLPAIRSASLFNISSMRCQTSRYNGRLTLSPQKSIYEQNCSTEAFAIGSPRYKRQTGSESSSDNLVPRSAFSTSNIVITESTTIGEILCLYLPYMADVYFQYCNCRSRANKHLQLKIDGNDRFREQLENFQEKTGGLSLHGYLTKPIQRVTRYPLLIEKILKHTPMDHSDYQAIQEAYDCARQLNERINRRISEQENSLRLDWLQEHLRFGNEDSCNDGYLFDELLKFNSNTRYNTQRQLILHGPIVKISSGKELLAFLFNDFLLLSTVKTTSSNWQTHLFEPNSSVHLKLYKNPIFLDDIVNVNEFNNDQLIFTISAKTLDKPLMLKAQQTNIRTLWLRSLTNAINECQTLEKSSLDEKAIFSLSDDTGHSRSIPASIILVVHAAFDLIPDSKHLNRHRAIYPYCEITINSQVFRTPYLKYNNSVQWHSEFNFTLTNIVDDVIHINLFDHEYFSPNENLGQMSFKLFDLIPCTIATLIDRRTQSISQRVYLNNGSSVQLECHVRIL